MMDTRTEGTMKEEQKLGKKRHNRGRNNEYGTVYYIREFFQKHIREGVKWSVNRIDLSGGGKKKGDIEIIIAEDTEILSLKESQNGFKTQYKILDEAGKDKIKVAGMRQLGEKYQRTVMVMYLDEYLKIRFGKYIKTENE